MPIVNTNAPLPFEIPTPDPIETTQPHVTPKGYKGKTVDSRYQKLANLITHIEGSRWNTTYYSQVLGDNNQPSPHSSSQHPVYQQYIKIFDHEIKVSSALTQSQDENNNMVVQGEATTYPKFIPNVGDTFIADVGDGREGIFHIYDVEKLSILQEACYRIQYQMSGYVSDLNDLQSDLDDKVVKTLYYRKDFLRYGQYPLLTEQEVVSIEDMERLYYELIQRYMYEFYNSQNNTLLAPDTKPTYDDFATKAFLAITEVVDHPTLRKVRPMNTHCDSKADDMTLWTLLLGSHKGLMNLAVRKMQVISNRDFVSWPVYGSIYHSNISRVVWPDGTMPTDNNWQGNYVEPPEPRQSTDPTIVDNGTYPQLATLDSYLSDPYLEDMGFPDGLGPEEDPDETDDITPPPTLRASHFGGFYVFSEDFYLGREEKMTALELVTWDAIHGNVFDPQLVISFAEAVPDMTPMDRYYYIPVIIALLKTGIRRY